MKILLHICCANCAVYPAKILRQEGHNFTGLWFNPNIHPSQEYALRLNSLKIFIDSSHIDMIYMKDYKPAEFFKIFSIDESNLISANGLNGLNSLNGFDGCDTVPVFIPRFPERCRSCYGLRLEKTAEQAQRQGFDAFSTTLLISPYQDYEQIAITGKELAEKYNVDFHLRDFRPYYREAMAYAKEFGLYRQKYCGCIFSKEEEKVKKGRKSKCQNLNVK